MHSWISSPLSYALLYVTQGRFESAADNAVAEMSAT